MIIYFAQNPRPGIKPFQPVETIIFRGRSVDMYDQSQIRRINDLKPLYIITQPQKYAGRMMFKKDVFHSEGPSGSISQDQYRKLWNKRHTVEIIPHIPLKTVKTSSDFASLLSQSTPPRPRTFSAASPNRLKLDEEEVDLEPTQRINFLEAEASSLNVVLAASRLRQASLNKLIH